LIAWHLHELIRRLVLLEERGDILRELALAGLGIIVEPTFIVDKHISDGTIVKILEDWQMEGYNLYAPYLTRRFLPAKVRVFIDYLTAIESQAGS
jgi:DNA-binding transcriptional LysR family regulator